MGKLTKIHAHRGSRGTHPENSMDAFKEALECHVDYIEIDIVMSRDGVPMVFHDMVISNRLCRQPDGKKISQVLPVFGLSASELQTYEVGQAYQPAFPDQKLHLGVRIPTLEQVCSWLQSTGLPVGLNIDCKIPSDGPSRLYHADKFLKSVLGVTSKYPLQGGYLYQSDNIRIAQAFMEAKVKTSVIYRYELTFEKKLKKLGGKMATPYHGLLTRKKVEWCNKEGIELATWTVNAKHRWERYIDWGVTGIITDYPRALHEHLLAQSASETSS